MTQSSDTTRLNKYLALHQGISRREADELIASGVVAINGERASLGARLQAGDAVTLRGAPITDTTNYRYIVFHKPVGFVCSRKKQGDAETIYALLPSELHTLKPVGRLDKDSSGILLLTNDGDFTYQMTHPSFHKQKTYHVTLDRDLEPLHQQMISDYGVQLEDGTSKLLLTRQSEDDRRRWQIDMHEGRNRQIRRTFAALGHTVTQLHRLQFSNYSLGDIKAGEWHDVAIS